MEVALLILKCLDVVCTHVTVQINSNPYSVHFNSALNSLLHLVFTFVFLYLYLGEHVKLTNAVAFFISLQLNSSILGTIF